MRTAWYLDLLFVLLWTALTWGILERHAWPEAVVTAGLLVLTYWAGTIRHHWRDP